MYRHTSCTENCSKLDRFIVINIRNKSTIWLMVFFQLTWTKGSNKNFWLKYVRCLSFKLSSLSWKTSKWIRLALVQSNHLAFPVFGNLKCCYAMYKIQQMKLPLKDHQQYISYQIYKNLKENIVHYRPVASFFKIGGGGLSTTLPPPIPQNPYPWGGGGEGYCFLYKFQPSTNPLVQLYIFYTIVCKLKNVCYEKKVSATPVHACVIK